MIGKCVFLGRSSIFHSTFSYHRAFVCKLKWGGDSIAKGRRFYSQQTRKVSSELEVSLSSEDVETFHECGVVCLRGFFGSEWITKVKKGIEKNIENPSKYSECLKSENAGTSRPQSQGSYFNDYCNWKTIGEFKDYVVNSPAAEIAGKLMKSKFAVFYHEHIFQKQEGVYREVPWHQDQSYYPIDGDQTCSIWMPVTPVSRDSCIKFVEGSHRTGWYYPRKFETSKLYETTSDKDDHNYGPTPDISASPEKYRLLSWDLEPGDCIAFHMRTIHGASKSSSASTRAVIATRWLGEDCRIVRRPWETSPPIIGGLQLGDSPRLSPDFPTLWNAQK